MPDVFDSETVEYNILIQASKAVEDLRKLTQSAETFTKKIEMASNAVKKFSAETGLSVKNTVATFKQMDDFVHKNDKMFGDFQKGWNEVGQAAEQGSQKAVRSIDAIRIALGVLVSMLIFQVIQVIQNTFREMIANVRESELAIYNLINAERRLSEQGIDITPKGLQETIDGLQKLVPILSRIQSEELVSRIATNVAPALRFDSKQIKEMSEAIALLYVRNKALGYSFDEVEKAITDAFLTGKVSQGINKFGVKLSDQIVKDEALRMGLVQTEEEFNNLTGEMEAQIKAAAMLSVVYQNATNDLESLDEYMQTTDAQIEFTKTKWSDFLTLLGEVFGPVLGQIMEMIAHGLKVAIALLEKATPLFEKFVASGVALADTFKGKAVTSPQQFLGMLASPGFWEEYSQNLQKAKDSMKDLGDAADTPTASIQNLQDAVDNFDAEEFRKKIEDIIEDGRRAQEDLDIKMGQKQDDLDLEYQRKAEDALKDYNRKIEDINADAERKKADLLRKSREEDLKAEQKYQLQLWELRMRFLMDLEDALHARDARQVIRLQKQYALDKEAARRKHELDKKQNASDLQADLARIEMERQRRLEDAKIEYEQKLDDQRKAKQRELDDLNLWYRREQQDLQQAIQRKLETLIKGWIDEGKITQQGAAQVYAILQSYFGPGGLTDQLYQYMMSSLHNAGAMASQYTPFATPGVLGGGSMGGDTHTRSGVQAFAEGGTLIATHPQTATFGEVPEVVSFAPLDGGGNNVGRIFGDKSALGGGMMELLLTLSPDLEARVVRKSLDGVADVVLKVNRSRS